MSTARFCLSLPFLGALALVAALAPMPAAATDSCYIWTEDGTCLDEPALPRTGQYSGADDHVDAPPAGIDAGNQPHGAVRLKEATFIDAHDICRYVDNTTTSGPGLFIGLKSRQEWAAFALEDKNPAGSTVIQCCRPIAVEVCGITRSIPYSRLGETGPSPIPAPWRPTGSLPPSTRPGSSTNWGSASPPATVRPAPVAAARRGSAGRVRRKSPGAASPSPMTTANPTAAGTTPPATTDPAEPTGAMMAAAREVAAPAAPTSLAADLRTADPYVSCPPSLPVPDSTGTAHRSYASRRRRSRACREARSTFAGD
mgnify:CR=1 FL=1